MSLVEEIDKKFFGELFVIIGGFIIANTIIRQFIELSDTIVPWWVLPAISFLIIMEGVNLKSNKANPSDIIFLIFLVTNITFLVLSANKILNVWLFIGSGILLGIWAIISWIFIRKK